MDIKNFEIYVFNNIYSINEIRLNTIPHIINTDDFPISKYNIPDFPPKLNSIDLDLYKLKTLEKTIKTKKCNEY